MKQYAFLFVILVLSISLPFFFNLNNYIEGYTNYSLAKAIGDFPEALTNVLVQDTYPAIGKNQISNMTAADMWWHYPTFKLGSYDQITNNIRYSNNLYSDPLKLTLWRSFLISKLRVLILKGPF